MCLAIPARIVEIIDDQVAISEVGGVRHTVYLALVDDIKIGDYVIVHVCYALSRLDPDEAAKTLALFAEAGFSSAHE